MNESLNLTIKIFLTMMLSGCFIWRQIYCFIEHEDDGVSQFVIFLGLTIFFICILGSIWGWDNR